MLRRSLVGCLVLLALLVSTHSSATAPLCGGPIYTVHTCSYKPAPPDCVDGQPCCMYAGYSITEQAFYCGNGEAVRGPGYQCLWPCTETTDDSALSCGGPPNQGEQCGASGHGNGVDDNYDGCVDENCIKGEPPCSCVKSCNGANQCGPSAAADCQIPKPPEVCGDGVDNSCTGVPDSSCRPPKDCGSSTAGDDPIVLASGAAITEAFTDFKVDTGLGELAITRTYASNDWAYAGGPLSAFGRGWHHEWEAWLSCSVATCTVARGLSPGFRFQASGTATSLDGSELWQIFAPWSNDALKDDHRNILVRRPSGEWIVFTTEGTELHFATACDACASAATDPYCQDASLGGKARLTKVVDARGNAVQLTYDRPGGRLLVLTDDLGHQLELRSASTCGSGLASELRYDGMVVAIYSFDGIDLTRAADADGSVLRSYVYDASAAGRLKTVKNEAGDAVAQFSYDAFGRAIGIVDKRSSAAVGYDAPGGIQVTEQYSGTSATSIRTLDRDGHATSISDGCACGPARTFQWTDRRLTCAVDAAGHATWQEFDTQGRLAHRAEYAGSTCPPSSLGDESREEWRDYGIVRAIAQGVSLPLERTTAIWRKSAQYGMAGSKIAETFSYEPASQAIDPLGYSCQQAPLPAGSVVCRTIEDGYGSYTDGAGLAYRDRHATFFSYDARGRLVRTVGPIALDQPSASDVTPVEERVYWPDGDTLPRRGRLMQVKRYGSPTAVPLVTAYDYDAFGPYQITAPDGGITTIVRDGRGRPSVVLAPGAAARQTRYHDTLDPRLVILPSGAAVRSRYDGVGRLASVERLSSDPEVPGATPAFGWGEYYAYDLAGNRVHTERRDATGAVTWKQDRQYDVQHQIVADTNPDAPSAAKTFSYDASGLLASVTDEDGRATAFTPDGIGRVKKIRRSGLDAQALDVAQYAYDPYSGLLSRALDGAARTTTYYHDDHGRVLRVISPNLKGGEWRFVYDARGNLVKRYDSHVTVTYTYDGLDRMLTMNASNSADGASRAYAFRYDEPGGVGRLTSVVEPERTVRYGYDTAGRLTTETIQENGIAPALVTNYGYDADGAVSQITYPSGLRVGFVRDPATREAVQVNNLDDGTRFADSIARLPGGPTASLAFGNGLSLSRTFDHRYEPQTISSGPLSLGYGITPGGDVASLAEGGATRTFGYDFLDRLTGSPGWLAYGYDGNGNRTAETVDGTSAFFSYNLDRVISKSLGSPPSGPAYQGCYTDQASPRALPTELMTSGATIESCMAAASARGLKYAGLQFYGYCFGGNTLQYAKVAESDCNAPCTANSAEICGGSWRNSIYTVPAQPAALSFAYDYQTNVSAIGQPPAPPPPYLGCYTDQYSPRALPTHLMTSGATIENCAAAAHAQGLHYAGLQYYDQCFGGNTLQYAKVAESDCNLPCTAGPGEICGGSWRNSIYDASSSSTAQYSVCLRHDPLGRMVLVGYTNGTITADATACATDASVTQTIARFRYDARGRRIARYWAATGEWTYVVSDGAGNPLSELALVNGAWIRVRDYVWLDGMPLAQIEYPGPGGGLQGYVYYFHADHLGQPRALTNSAGAVVWSATKRPYGEIVESTSPDPQNGRTVVTNLRLPGQYDERLLGGIGLQGPYYNWNRWYLPGVGRYLELDPIALRGGFNGEYGPDWYTYAGGNPLSFIDPTGSSKFDKFFGLPRKFWNWYHRHVKRPGDPDLDKKAAEDLYKEWERLGKPGPDKGRGRGGDGEGGGGGWDDFFDLIIPTPPFFNLCQFRPDLCRPADPCKPGGA